MIDFDAIELLSFDCYGTLVDWESGILATLGPFFRRRGVSVDDDHLLELYARLEPMAQDGEFVPYREVLRRVMHGYAQVLRLELAPGEEEALVESLPRWRPFDDTRAALTQLAGRFRLMVLSNIDADLFDRTRPALGVDFDWVVTAEEARSYKPSSRNFEVARDTSRIPLARWVHVAQSLYHDIVPAKEAGIATVWINRRGERPGFGATPPAQAQPDLELANLDELVSRVETARR